MPTAPVRMRCSAVEYDAATADDDGHVELANELLQVERLARGVVGDVFGRNHGALHDEHVELGIEHVLRVLLVTLRGVSDAARSRRRRL